MPRPKPFTDALVAAQSRGERYYLGRPCRRHPELSGKRFVSSRTCPACGLEWVKRRYQPTGRPPGAARQFTPKELSARRRERSRARRASYSEEKRAEIREQNRLYRLRSKDLARETQRRWRERNRDRVNQLAASRRCQTPPWADRAKILSIYALAAELSRLTGAPHEVDHVIPLHGRRVSGLHVEDNLAVLPRSANRRKSRSFESA